jgi:hypothetical protein
VVKSKITGGQGSHNKHIGCGASGAYAAGPDNEEARSQIYEKRLVASSCLSVYPHGTARLSLDVFSRNVSNFSKIYVEN